MQKAQVKPTRGPPPADGASFVFLPLVEDPPQAWSREDRGGGEQIVMLPPSPDPSRQGRGIQRMPSCRAEAFGED
jgi:hypothetical protein